MKSTGKNVLYAQSGGGTAVINATASGLIHGVHDKRPAMGRIFAAQNGIVGAIEENLIDVDLLKKDDLALLANSPAGSFGSCRYKLPDSLEETSIYNRLLEVLRAYDIGYFFYNGGGDSQDTVWKVAQYAKTRNYPIIAIGIPKTVDNDLEGTDCCPGFGSAAKYIATSIKEVALDLKSVANSSSKIMVIEVMGRNTGWMAAASGLASANTEDAPHMIVFPEVSLDLAKICSCTRLCVEKYGNCLIVTSEGARFANGELLAHRGLSQSANLTKDAFGHAELGGAGKMIATRIKQELGYKTRYAIMGYLQRCARHVASQVDVEQAFAVGREAVATALRNDSETMITIQKKTDEPYTWVCSSIPLEMVTNREKKLPNSFIGKDGMSISQACRKYLTPLICGESLPAFKDGLPMYFEDKHTLVEKKLPDFKLPLRTVE